MDRPIRTIFSPHSCTQTPHTHYRNCGIRSLCIALGLPGHDQETALLLTRRHERGPSADKIAGSGATLPELVELAADLPAVASARGLHCGSIGPEGLPNEDALRRVLLAALESPLRCAIVNYHMPTLGQGEHLGGHFSPVSGYSAKRDAFLILDTWPETAPLWATTAALWGACATADKESGAARGILELVAASPPPLYPYQRVVPPPLCVADRRRAVFQLPGHRNTVRVLVGLPGSLHRCVVEVVEGTVVHERRFVEGQTMEGRRLSDGEVGTVAAGDGAPLSDRYVSSLDEFKANFDAFSNGQLRFLNWDNVAVVGGSVLASMRCHRVARAAEDATTEEEEEKMSVGVGGGGGGRGGGGGGDGGDGSDAGNGDGGGDVVQEAKMEECRASIRAENAMMLMAQHTVTQELEHRGVVDQGPYLPYRLPFVVYVSCVCLVCVLCVSCVCLVCFLCVSRVWGYHATPYHSLYVN